MKQFLLISAWFFCVVCTGWAQTTGSSIKPTSGTNGSSVITCRVNFDASGHKTVVLTKSTGSKVLDDRLQAVAGEHINGLRNTSLPVSFMCKAIKVPTSHGKMLVRVATTHPPYPYQARARHEQGSGVVKASFDENGHVVSAEMVQSTGSKILDGNTVNYALARWRSSGGAKVTTTVPIAYQLR